MAASNHYNATTHTPQPMQLTQVDSTPNPGTINTPSYTSQSRGQINPSFRPERSVTFRAPVHHSTPYFNTPASGQDHTRAVPPRQLVHGYYNEHTGSDASSQDCLIDIEEREENPPSNSNNLTAHHSNPPSRPTPPTIPSNHHTANPPPHYNSHNFNNPPTHSTVQRDQPHNLLNNAPPSSVMQHAAPYPENTPYRPDPTPPAPAGPSNPFGISGPHNSGTQPQGHTPTYAAPGIPTGPQYPDPYQTVPSYHTRPYPSVNPFVPPSNNNPQPPPNHSARNGSTVNSISGMGNFSPRVDSYKGDSPIAPFLFQYELLANSYGWDNASRVGQRLYRLPFFFPGNL